MVSTLPDWFESGDDDVSFFAKMEQACAVFIERSFAKTFPSDLEPAQIARKLVATMEARTRGDAGHLLAPGAYLVFMHPDDFARLAEHRGYLEREWGELLRDIATRVGVYFYDGSPSVAMEPRDGVPVGTVEIMVATDVTIAINPPPPPPPKRRHVLRMLKGVPAYGVYAIGERASVGRSDESDIFLVDPSVSRAHATIDSEDGESILHDLGSTNGTFVNGERVEGRRHLRDGDVVMFGNTEMRVEVSGE